MKQKKESPMKFFRRAAIAVVLTLILGCGVALAKADTVDMFANAVITGDISVLEKTLSPNFWYIGANGHIRDKEHFIQEIKDKQLVVDRLTLLNNRETKVGGTRLVTANGVFHGKSVVPLPDGLMRYSMVLADNNGHEQVALFQVTPVIATKECQDGNCKLK